MVTEEDHIEPKGDDVSGHVNQMMETEDTNVEDNCIEHTEPEDDVNQGMETEETDENAMESMEGNDTDETDYTRGVKVEIETEYESGRHLFQRGI